MIDAYMEQLGRLLRNSRNAEWLDSAISRLDESSQLVDELALQSAMARRKLGEGRLAPGSYCIDTGQGRIDVGAWRLGDAGRVYLVLYAIRMDRLDRIKLVQEWFRVADESERAAVVRGLILLTETDALKPVALECGRTNSITLYEALAIHNPYPAAFYTQHEFNQLVLKSLFTGVKIQYVLGLSKRTNEELSRMCEDYHDERVLAGRSVPVDIWLALGPCASQRGEGLLIDYAANENREHRRYAYLALQQRLCLNPDLVRTLESRLGIETDPELVALLQQYLRAE